MGLWSEGVWTLDLSAAFFAIDRCRPTTMASTLASRSSRWARPRCRSLVLHQWARSSRPHRIPAHFKGSCRVSRRPRAAAEQQPRGPGDDTHGLPIDRHARRAAHRARHRRCIALGLRIDAGRRSGSGCGGDGRCGAGVEGQVPRLPRRSDDQVRRRQAGRGDRRRLRSLGAPQARLHRPATTPRSASSIRRTRSARSSRRSARSATATSSRRSPAASTAGAAAGEKAIKDCMGCHDSLHRVLQGG